MSVHVAPVADLVEHQLDSECCCGPELEVAEGSADLWIHHSLDGREAREHHASSPGWIALADD
jgi:hypothetical protein